MDTAMNHDDERAPSHDSRALKAERPARSLTEVQILSSAQKASIILASFGPEIATPIVERLSDTQLNAFVRAFEHIKSVPREQVLAVIADFVTSLEHMRGGMRGGPKAARELAETLLDSERAKRIFENTVPSLASGDTKAASVWPQFLAQTSEDIANFILTQRPNVGSVILSKIPSVKASEILAELPDDFTVKLIAQLSKGLPIPDHVVSAVERLIQTQMLDSDTSDGDNASLTYISELLGMVSKSKREAVLEGIHAQDPERAVQIKSGMLIFEDLPARLPPTAIPIIFKDFAKPDLYRALKAGSGISEEAVAYLYANISQRMASSVQEEVSELDDLDERQADKAISTLMMFIGDLVSSERVSLIALET